MKPYYQDNDVVIYHGNSIEILPELGRFDLAITDPPYGVEGGHGGQTKDYRKADYGKSWADDPEYIKTICVPVIQMCIDKCSTVVMTPGTRCCCSYPQPEEVGCFFHPAASRIGKFGWCSCTPIFYYGYYMNRGKGAIPTGISVVESSEKNGHPCPKPINAWRWLFQRCIATGLESILDPFAGSGTTGRIAKDYHHKCTMIEREERFCEIAARRCSQEVLAL